jgi:hypothetical protein
MLISSTQAVAAGSAWMLLPGKGCWIGLNAVARQRLQADLTWSMLPVYSHE